MKILHLISQHPESTGSGFYLQNIIRQAKTAGHQNYLIAGISGRQIPELDCISRQSCYFVRFGEGLLDFTIPGMSDVMPYPSSRFSALSPGQVDAYERAFAQALERVVAEFCPDIIHSHHLWLVSAVARRLFPDIPMVTSCHSTGLRQFAQNPHLRGRVLPHCRQINRLLALSRDQQENIHKNYSIPEHGIDIVGGGFDQDLFAFKSKAKTPPVQLLYGGKLSSAKGVDWLLRTFNKHSDRRLHLHLAGSGSGEEQRQCLELAAMNSAAVTVHGRISQQELAGLMGHCHIFILPSFYEGMPLVLLEALASGCRIITTDLPGCLELLGDVGADLVEFVKLPVMEKIDCPAPADLPLLEKRLRAAIQNMVARVELSPSLDFKKINKVTSSFGWQAVFRRISNSYDKALRG